ncbi:ABC transporter substrate-binding protein [Lacrimispora sp. 38-1]|uniref:ABC transporter substrate-binding protein n=1 Tax=Lacrimispora sp. 38-1 TaxID=3125778 RepID=UPI003CF4DC4D
MRFKRVMVTVLAVGMIGTLVIGCGSKEKKAATNEKGAAVIQVWVHHTNETPEGKAYEELVKEFNDQHKGEIEVQLTGIARTGDAGGYDDKINAAITNSSMPDVFTIDGPTVAANADAGVIVPIGEYFDEADLADFNKDIIQQGTYNNELYTLGTFDSSVCIYYNSDMFAAAGITPATAQDPWTWEEFTEACKKLKTESVFGANLGLSDIGEWLTYAYLPLIQSGDGSIVSDDGEETVDGYLNGQATADALTFIKNLVDDGLVSATPEDYTFEKGSSAMTFSGPWEIATLKDFPEIKWGTMPYPIKTEGAVSASPCGSWTYGVSKDCPEDKRAAAVEVIKWLTDTESCVKMYEAISMPPARQSSFSKITAYQEAPLDVFSYQMANTAIARPIVVNYPILSDKFAKAVANVASGMDVQQALDDAVEQYNFQVGK